MWSMDAAETTDAIGEVQAAEAQLAERNAALPSHDVAHRPARRHRQVLDPGTGTP